MQNYDMPEGDLKLALIEANVRVVALEVERDGLKALVTRIKWIMGTHGMPQSFFRDRNSLEAWDLWQISKAIHKHEGTEPCLPWKVKEEVWAQRHQRHAAPPKEPT